MKNLVLTVLLGIGCITAIGQTTETKTTAVSNKGVVLEIKSNLPSEMIPGNAVIASDGKVKTINGEVIGVAVAKSVIGSGPGNGGLKPGDWIWIHNGN